MFSFEFYEVSKSIFISQDLWMTASVDDKLQSKVVHLYNKSLKGTFGVNATKPVIWFFLCTLCSWVKTSKFFDTFLSFESLTKRYKMLHQRCLARFQTRLWIYTNKQGAETYYFIFWCPEVSPLMNSPWWIPTCVRLGFGLGLD